MLGSLILYIKGMRIRMFQLSGFCCKGLRRFLGGFRGLCQSATGPKEPQVAPRVQRTQ